MSRCRFTCALQVAIVIASFASTGTARADVALGASFGYTHYSYPDIPDFTNDVVGIPGSQEWGQPGLRIGYIAPGGRWDVNVDVGLMHRSGTIGVDVTTVEVLPQVQVNGRGRGGVNPFVNAGVGLLHESAPNPFSEPSGTRPVAGAGIGVRRPVSDGHGLVRFELRYDYVWERVKELSPSSTFIFPATNMFSVKLGFDLVWPTDSGHAGR